MERLARDAKAAGIDGCLLTDASVEEAAGYVRSCGSRIWIRFFLVAPTSSDRRLRLVSEYSRGFIYLVSRTGVTGAQSSVGASLSAVGGEGASGFRTCRWRLGFGVSKPEHVTEIGKWRKAWWWAARSWM